MELVTHERTRYFAERIIRTGMARAYNDGAMAKYMEGDDIETVQWKLSSTHPCYDICDLYANADLYGLDKGIFPKDKVPMLPDEALAQIERVFNNTRTDFVHKVVVIENGKVITIKRRT